MISSVANLRLSVGIQPEISNLALNVRKLQLCAASCFLTHDASAAEAASLLG